MGDYKGPRPLWHPLHAACGRCSIRLASQLARRRRIPYTEVDSKGQPLNGANKYTLTFAKGQTPPVEGFSSITMYVIDGGWWFVPNSLNKFTVSPRNHL